ncbi:MAG TPA: hypothetical protein VGW74_09260 [Propionibacteriaceae bacterium]|nr:hypothetical protein [Propionibacteriaceae bacterium]
MSDTDPLAALIRAMLPTIQAVVTATVREGLRSESAISAVPGTVVAVDGRSCTVEPVDRQGAEIPATRIQGAAAGSPVVLLFLGPGQTFALPIAQ